MALDCFIVVESSDGYVVHRYKTSEFLEAITVPQETRNTNSFYVKRAKIVDQFVKDGKPQDVVYWIEQDQIKKTVLPKTKDNNPNPKIVVGNITNGYAQVWVNGKNTEIRVPPGMSHEEFNDLVHRVTGKDKDDGPDFTGIHGWGSADHANQYSLLQGTS